MMVIQWDFQEYGWVNVDIFSFKLTDTFRCIMNFEFAKKHFRTLYKYLDADEVHEDEISSLLSACEPKVCDVLYRSILIKSDEDFNKICNKISQLGIMRRFKNTDDEQKVRICSSSIDLPSSVTACIATNSVSGEGYVVTYKLTGAIAVLDYSDICEFVLDYTPELIKEYPENWELSENYHSNTRRIFNEKECIILTEGLQSEIVYSATQQEFKASYK